MSNIKCPTSSPYVRKTHCNTCGWFFARDSVICWQGSPWRPETLTGPPQLIDNSRWSVVEFLLMSRLEVAPRHGDARCWSVGHHPRPPASASAAAAAQSTRSRAAWRSARKNDHVMQLLRDLNLICAPGRTNSCHLAAVFCCSYYKAIRSPCVDRWWAVHRGLYYTNALKIPFPRRTWASLTSAAYGGHNRRRSCRCTAVTRCRSNLGDWAAPRRRGGDAEAEEARVWNSLPSSLHGI